MTLADVIGTELSRYQVSAIEDAIFGSREPATIASVIETFCREHLDEGVEEGLFYRGSAGCTFGVRLTSGDRVVLKVFQSRWSAPFLQAVHRVQEHVVATGFPCPKPVLGPTGLAHASTHLVTVESYLPDPGLRPFSGRHDLTASATGLAQLVRCCEGVDGSGLDLHPLGQTTASLYPEPHSPLFDFRATSDGAEWIDNLALAAQEARNADPTQPVVAHTDWSARNVRIVDAQVVAVYDWDSVALVSESTAVGQAAMTWRITSEPGDGSFPDAGEIAEYFTAYEVASGKEMTSTEWRSAAGAALYVLAYTARCEHALMANGVARPDQHSASRRLRSDGPDLLDFGQKR